MSIQYVEKNEWHAKMHRQESLLLGAFEPSLSKITVEIECRECGRPVYVSPRELGDATVICIVCGLKYFEEPDRETISKALIPQA